MSAQSEAEDVDIDPADLVAELDEEPPADLPDTTDDIINEPLFTGSAIGGPLDGVTVESRYPKGGLFIDIERGELWVYDRRDDGAFCVRSEASEPIYDDGPVNRWRAADEEHYDIWVPGMAFGGDDA